MRRPELSRRRGPAAARGWGWRLGLIAVVGAIGAAAGCGNSSDTAAAHGCSRDADCSGGLVCDPTIAECIEGKAGAGGGGGAGGKAGGPAVQDDSVASDAPCTVLPQSGCPTGHACLVANASGTTSCYTVGALPAGAACTGFNECSAGLICAYGQCRSICASLSDCGSRPYGQCYPYTVGEAMTPLPHFGFCSLQCNPADPTNKAGRADFAACLAGSTCFPSDAPASGSTECYQAGTKGSGSSCKQVSDCAPGMTCLNLPSGSECTPLCLVGQSSCPSGSCQGFAEKQYVGTKSALLEVGACY
jgi:hypothetical protein